MNICLKTLSKQDELQQVDVSLVERLPETIQSPCELNCEFKIENSGNYYLLKLSVAGVLAINCQRCLGVFHHDYYNQTELAICANDAIAETLMEHFDCIVAEDNQVDLEEIITDELYLFAPEKHENRVDCDTDIAQLIGHQS